MANHRLDDTRPPPGQSRVPANTPDSVRFALLIQTAKLIAGNEVHLCVIRDASSEGVRVRHFNHLPDGDGLILELSSDERFRVELTWRDAEFAGLHFPDPAELERIVNLTREDSRRRFLRLDVLLKATLSWDSETCAATIKNISQQGACIDSKAQLVAHQRVRISADNFGPLQAKIRWARAPEFGLLFDEKLTLEQLAKLKSSGS